MAKTAFDMPRNTTYTADPITQLCIIGGQNPSVKLPKNEWGDLDTDDGDEHPLFDENLFDALPQEFIDSIDLDGVIEPIVICKIDIGKDAAGNPIEAAVVTAGRKRVRAARIVNRMRAKETPPRDPVVIDCKVRRGNLTSQMGAMISENSIRVADSGETMVAKLKRYLDQSGTSIEMAAIRFGKSPATLQALLDYDDKAIKGLKKAVEDGVMTITAASEIAKNPSDKQREILDGLLLTHGATGGDGKPAKPITRNAAKTAAKRAKAGNDEVEILSKRDGLRLLKFVSGKDHPQNTSDKTLAYWEGVEDGLSILLAQEGVDARLTKALADCREAEKERQKEKERKIKERAAKAEKAAKEAAAAAKAAK